MARRPARFLAGATITRGALILLVASSVVSLGFLLLGTDLQLEVVDLVGASAGSLWHQGKVWQLVTSPLLEPRFVGLLFQGLMLWMFLPTLERWWGTGRFLRFALYTSLAGVVGGTVVGLTLGGAQAAVLVTGLDPFVFAAMVAFGVLYATQPVRLFGALQMTGRQMAIGITAVTALLLVVGQRWVEGAADAAAMLVAVAMTFTRSNPRLWWLNWKQRRARGKLGVVSGGTSGPRWMN